MNPSYIRLFQIFSRRNLERVNVLINISNRESNKINKKRRSYIILIRRERDSKLDISIFKISITHLKRVLYTLIIIRIILLHKNIKRS